jgi:CBS domain-containing protein
MDVRQGMSDDVVTVTPASTLKEAADKMADRNCGSVVVMDPEQPGPGIFTERDLLRAVAEGGNPNSEKVADHLTDKGTFAEPDWPLEKAAQSMLRGGFRHLVVMDGGEPIGVLSMRDIVRCWAEDEQPRD